MNRQNRPGGPWFPWYRYEVLTNLIDGRCTMVTHFIRHTVEVLSYPSRPLGRYEACRIEDRVEY